MIFVKEQEILPHQSMQNIQRHVKYDVNNTKVERKWEDYLLKNFGSLYHMKEPRPCVIPCSSSFIVSDLFLLHGEG